MVTEEMDGTGRQAGTILLIGASRGLGLAMAADLARRGWSVTGTVRGERRTPLHALAEAHPGRLAIERLDVTRPEEIAALRARLTGRSFDILFVNAGTANADQDETIAETTTEEFVRVMVTNALGPMRVVEALQELVAPAGMIGIMSSGQGSIANNVKGGHEVYRGSKAALNQYMRCYAARHRGGARALLLLAPGWIRTELGGPDAPTSLEEAIPEVVDVLLSQQGKPGLRYVDRHGFDIAW